MRRDQRESSTPVSPVELEVGGMEDEDLGLVEDQGRLLSEFKKSCFQYVMNSQDVER